MPKEPETVDRFRITAEVAPAELGPMLATFAKMGLQNIGYELVTDVLNYKKKHRNGDSFEFAKTWIDERHSFKLGELMQYFEESGRGRSSVNGPIARLIDEGELKALGNGYYERVPRQLAPPQAFATPDEPKVHAATGKPSPRFDISGEEAIWRHVKNRTKPFKAVELRTLFTAQGRNPASVSPVVDKMIKRKLLKRVEDGVYQVVSGAKLKTEKKIEKKAAAANTARAKNLTKDRYKVSNRDLLTNFLKSRSTFTSAEVAELFAKEKRPPASGTSMLSVIKKAGLVKVIGENEYEVVKMPNNSINGTGTGEHVNG